MKLANYPIHAELVRKVGVKMGKGYALIPQRDPVTGVVIRDSQNNPIMDSDFTALRERFSAFSSKLALCKTGKTAKRSAVIYPDWVGGRIDDILDHPMLDMKPRRLAPKAVALRSALSSDGNAFLLSRVADVLQATIDLSEPSNFIRKWRLVEGTSIRAVEGTVVPTLPLRAWQVIEDKQRRVYMLQDGDIIIGLVRPERRNVGFLIDQEQDLIGAPDGVAVVRIKPENDFSVTQNLLFALLRSEVARVQLWTESGGTSYGKLRLENIQDLRLPLYGNNQRAEISGKVDRWAESVRASQAIFNSIGSSEDRVPIINSPILGLEPD